MVNLENKWVRGAIPALLLHCSIGSVYAWSLFVDPISNLLGNVSSQQVQMAFSLAIFFLGMSAAFGGKFVEKNVKRSALISLCCFVGGLLVTSISVYFKSLIGIYLGYGCLMGIGLGVGYITPVKTIMLWFEDQKGLATGLAITGFGLASAIASPIITHLNSNLPLHMTFLILGILYTIPMFLAMILIHKPKDYVEPPEDESFKLLSMFKKPAFVSIWIMIYINISAGLALISIAAPLMKELGIALIVSTVIVGVMGVFNGSGRLVFSAASDYLKDRVTIYEVIFILSIVMMVLAMVYPLSSVLGLLIISATYGAGFSCLPSLLSDKFGMNHISKIHGLALTAWAMAGLTGNQISAYVQQTTGTYTPVFVILLVMYIVGLSMSFVLRRYGKNEVEVL